MRRRSLQAAGRASKEQEEEETKTPGVGAVDTEHVTTETEGDEGMLLQAALTLKKCFP